MKTTVTITIENEIGNPSIEDIQFFMRKVLEKGITRELDLFQHIPMSAVSFRILDIKRANDE